TAAASAALPAAALAAANVSGSSGPEGGMPRPSWPARPRSCTVAQAGAGGGGRARAGGSGEGGGGGAGGGGGGAGRGERRVARAGSNGTASTARPMRFQPPGDAKG